MNPPYWFKCDNELNVFGQMKQDIKEITRKLVFFNILIFSLLRMFVCFWLNASCEYNLIKPQTLKLYVLANENALLILSTTSWEFGVTTEHRSQNKPLKRLYQVKMLIIWRGPLGLHETAMGLFTTMSFCSPTSDCLDHTVHINGRYVMA